MMNLGCVVEMRMGEGKMLIVVLFFYVVVLEGKGVYLVIVNDYFVWCDVE